MDKWHSHEYPENGTDGIMCSFGPMSLAGGVIPNLEQKQHGSRTFFYSFVSS
jgi:hypothetical protein